MNNKKSQTALDFVQILINGRETERIRIQSEIEHNPECIDIATFKHHIIEALKTVPPGKEDLEEDNDIALTRSWLLSALARVSVGDKEIEAIIHKHLDPGYETKRTIRGWTLAGLVAAQTPDIEKLARQSLEVEENNWVRQLSVAILASCSKDEQEVKTLTESILSALNDKKNPRLREDTARAVRIVHLPAVVNTLCAIVEEGDYSDTTHEAIIALGNIPRSSRRIQAASRALTRFVTEQRRSSRRDGMRAKALISLGNLRVENAGFVLLEELYDDNPSIVREAARSLEKTLGIRTATLRIVESASKIETPPIQRLARALRWMDPNNSGAIEEVLEDNMVSGSPEQQEVSRHLLSDMGGAIALQKLRAQTNVMEQYQQTLKEADIRVQDLFERSIAEARSGFKIATRMDVTVFGVGILLILVSAIFALVNQGNLNGWAGIATGSLGVLGVLYSILIAKPRNRVRATVDHLMYLKIIFLGYLRQLHQTDQAFTRRLLEDENISHKEVENFSRMIGENVRNAVGQLSSTIDPETNLSSAQQVEMAQAAKTTLLKKDD